MTIPGSCYDVTIMRPKTPMTEMSSVQKVCRILEIIEERFPTKSGYIIAVFLSGVQEIESTTQLLQMRTATTAFQRNLKVFAMHAKLTRAQKVITLH